MKLLIGILAFAWVPAAFSKTITFEGDSAETIFRFAPKMGMDDHNVLESRPLPCQTENDNLMPGNYPQTFGFHCTMVNQTTMASGESSYQEYGTKIFQSLKDAGVKIKADNYGPALRVQSVQCSRNVKEARKGYRCVGTE